MLQWANRIDDVHRQRTVLKTAIGCGTHFLGVASMKINSRKACGTRLRIDLLYDLREKTHFLDSLILRELRILSFVKTNTVERLYFARVQFIPSNNVEIR